MEAIHIDYLSPITRAFGGSDFVTENDPLTVLSELCKKLQESGLKLSERSQTHFKGVKDGVIITAWITQNY